MLTLTEKMAFKLNHQEKKIVLLTALGGMLEFYDFIIYGIFSVYFAHQFFPSENALISIIKSYVIFILGYIARPLGGIIFSHLGDEYGRKKILVITIVLMGFASLGIGLIPTYNQIGISAPILLLCFRLIQGFALGGELPSTYVYLSESMPTKQGSGFGLTLLGINFGVLLAMLMNQMLNYFLTLEEINAYGWRLPFIFGGMLCLISYRIRTTLHETLAFIKTRDKPIFPLLYLLRYHFSEVCMGIMITSIMAGFAVVTILFMPTYLNSILKIDHTLISHLISSALFINMLAIYMVGRLANRMSPDLILSILLVGCALCIPFSYWLIKNNYLTSGILILNILEGAIIMIVPLLICTLFPTKIRLTGVAFSYNLSFTLFGGLAPIIITSLIQAGFNPYFVPAAYLIILVCLCGFGLIYKSCHSLKNERYR